MDKRKFNGGHKNGGRKKGIGISYDIQRHCNKMITDMLKDDFIKQKALKQISVEFESNNEEYLYVIENNGIYKIGYTSNWVERSRTYRTHLGKINLIFLFKNENCYDIEQELHRLFLDKNEHQNEWFNLEQKDIIKIVSYCSSKIK